MENNTNNKVTVADINSFKDYLNLIRTNLFPIILIILASLIVAVLYAVNAKDIYRSETTLKISKPQGSILESPLIPGFNDYGSDRFIANEIEIIKSYNTRERVAKALVDTFNNSKNRQKFYLVLQKEFNFEKTPKTILSLPSIVEVLQSAVVVSQKRGLDIIEINAESPSPYEAALIANCFAQEYKNLNLDVSRNQLTFVKNFLDDQKKEKQAELRKAEETLRSFQEKGGIVALDAQANSLIEQLSEFEAQKNAAQIDLMASTQILSQIKKDLDQQDPRLADYLKSFASEVYFKSLQEQIARLEVNRDLALSEKNAAFDNKNLVAEYNTKINELQNKLNQKIEEIKAGIFASSPEEVKDLSQKIISEEIKNQSLKISLSELENIVNKYETKFNKLPKTSIELARYQRQREALEKLYLLVEEKYQEALINEQSQPGNVLIIDNARIPINPSKPNRFLIVIIGIVFGSGIALGYVFIKNYFDNTVKTPEDIQKRNINILAWIPRIEGAGQNGQKEFELIVAKKPDSVPSEAFRALRTRVQFSKVDSKPLNSILITSPAQQEGKTTIAVNLAGSFAQTNRKTLIIDCDLRKPRVHAVFDAQRFPGLIDYLFAKASLQEIIRPSGVDNLSYITSGTIPPNPAEMLESKKMREFLHDVSSMFDIMILDSAPIIAVTDSEIIAKLVDATILIVSADTTEHELMVKSVELIKSGSSSFIGTVLNNFSYKSGYGSYYKYYYYYTHPSNGNKLKSSSPEGMGNQKIDT